MERIDSFSKEAESVAAIKGFIEKNEAAIMLKKRYKVEFTDNKAALLNVASVLAKASSDDQNHIRFMELLQIAVNAMVDSFIYD